MRVIDVSFWFVCLSVLLFNSSFSLSGLFVCLFFCFSFFLSVKWCVSIYPSVSQSVCLSVCLSVYLTICLSVCQDAEAYESALMAYGEYVSESWNATTSLHTVKIDSPNGREYYQLITGVQVRWERCTKTLPLSLTISYSFDLSLSLAHLLSRPLVRSRIFSFSPSQTHAHTHPLTHSLFHAHTFIYLSISTALSLSLSPFLSRTHARSLGHSPTQSLIYARTRLLTPLSHSISYKHTPSLSLGRPLSLSKCLKVSLSNPHTNTHKNTWTYHHLHTTNTGPYNLGEIDENHQRYLTNMPSWIDSGATLWSLPMSFCVSPSCSLHAHLSCALTLSVFLSMLRHLKFYFCVRKLPTRLQISCKRKWGSKNVQRFESAPCVREKNRVITLCSEKKVELIRQKTHT